MLAGVAATGEEEDFSIISAGIFFFVANIPQMQRNYGPPVPKKGGRGKRKKGCELRVCQLAAIQSTLALREKKKEEEKKRGKKTS